MTIKRFFPGNNTSRGFYSLFENIHCGYEFKFIIKGGPGTGKSSYINKITEELKKLSSVELLYCASDSTSLDGAAFPDLNTIIMDGTHPHVIDPQFPAAGEHIIDLARYLDENKLLEKKDKIIKIHSQVRSHYQVAYSYFRQAKETLSRRLQLHDPHNNLDKLEELKSLFIEPVKQQADKSPILNVDKNKKQSSRSLFLRGYTPEGIISFAEDLIDSRTKLLLLETDIHTSDILLRSIKNYFLLSGQRLEYYLHPLSPDIIEGIRFPQMNIIYLATENYPDVLEFKENIYYKASISPNSLGSSHSRFQTNELKRTIKQEDKLINLGIQCLSEMKETRKFLENYYSSAQDFNSVEKNRKSIAKKIKRLTGHDYY